MLKEYERKNRVNYACDYQSDSFLEKKTTFEYYNTSNKPVHMLFIFLLKVFILGLFVWIVYNLERQLHDIMAHFSVAWFTWQFPLARLSSTGTQRERETWRFYLGIASHCVEPWCLTEESEVPEMNLQCRNLCNAESCHLNISFL